MLGGDISKTPFSRMVKASFFTVLLAFVGYFIPILIFAAVSLTRGDTMSGIINAVVRSHLEFRPGHKPSLEPSIGFAAIFAMSAIVSFAPSNSLGFVPSLIRLGGSAIIGVIAMVLASSLFGLEPQSYTLDPFHWVRLAIVAAFPIVVAACLLIRQPQDDGGPSKQNR